MLDQDQALHSIRLFLEDAEPCARGLLRDPQGSQMADLRRTADRLAADLLNALVIVRLLQPTGRAFELPGPLPARMWGRREA
ncbi:MAG: hypothetical protein WCO20_06920 [Holophagaceae bacterium]